MKILLDTCIVIDALQKREPFWQDAEKIFVKTGEDSLTSCISAKSITDIHYLMRKNLHSEEKARALLKGIFNLFEIIDTSAQDCINAADSEMSDYEDAVQVESAASFVLDCIVTRNISDYAKSALPVYSPSEFLEKYFS